GPAQRRRRWQNPGCRGRPSDVCPARRPLQTHHPGCLAAPRKVGGVGRVGACGDVGDARRIVGRGAATALDDKLGFGSQGNALGVGSNVQLGQQVDAVFQGAHIDVARGSHQTPAEALHEQAHALAGAGQQAFTDGKAGVPRAAQGQVFARGDVAGARRGQRDACRAGEDQMRQILVVLRFVGSRFGADQQAGARPHGTMTIGAQLEAFASRLAAGRSRVGQIPEVDGTGAVIAAQRNTDFAGGVINAQLVATAAFVFLALDRGQGLEVRQLVRRQMDAVIQAAGNQRLVGVAFEKGDQHFHANPRQIDGSQVLARPVGRHAHPAAGLVVGLPFPVPEKLHLHPAVLIGVNLLAFGACHDGALGAEYFGFWMFQRRAVVNVPGGCAEAVAITLMKTRLEVTNVTCDNLLKHLRLFAFVEDFGQQPQVIPCRVGVPGQCEKVTGHQPWLIAAAFGQPEVAAVAFQGAVGQLPASLTVNEAAGIVVIFQVWNGRACGSAFQLEPRLGEVVVAPGGAAGARIEAQPEALDNLAVRHQSGVLLIQRRRELREHRLVIAKHQQVAFGAVLKMKVNAFLFAQTLDEVQVGLVVLNAVHALGVGCAELEPVITREDAMLLQHAADDLPHCHLLEDPLVYSVCKVSKLRTQAHSITGQAFAGFSLGDARRVFADQFQLELEWMVQSFAAGEGQHLKQRVLTIHGEAELSFICRCEHPVFLVRCDRSPNAMGSVRRTTELSRDVPASAQLRRDKGLRALKPEPGHVQGR
nr:hypothetical protein [Tanacetum cinerariifolium]